MMMSSLQDLSRLRKDTMVGVQKGEWWNDVNDDDGNDGNQSKNGKERRGICICIPIPIIHVNKVLGSK
jgi:hypothetical protein